MQGEDPNLNPPCRTQRPKLDSNVLSLGSGCGSPSTTTAQVGKGNCLGAHWDIVLPVPAFYLAFLRPRSIINEVWVTTETEIEFNVVINLKGDVDDGARTRVLNCRMKRPRACSVGIVVKGIHS
jgi:hypothetical protein